MTVYALDPETGEWSWETDSDPSYLGDWTLCLAVSDGANTCTLDPDLCDSPSNADTACYTIRVFGIAVTIEKDEGETGHGAIQGHMTEVSIYLESADAYSIEGYDAFIGGFDFLIAYDASALTAIKALALAMYEHRDLTIPVILHQNPGLAQLINAERRNFV